MMARSLRAPSVGRIQKRKTNFSKSIIFGLQRAAGPYRRANSVTLYCEQAANGPWLPSPNPFRPSQVRHAKGKE
jgi:hypothetical protein